MRTTLQLFRVLVFVSFSSQAMSQPESNQQVWESNIGTTVYDDRTSVTFEELLADPAAFDKRHVQITGVLDDQNSRGYWLYQPDQSARIHVMIPWQLTQLAAKTVTIYGTVNVQRGVPSIVAKEIKQ